jgi:hypothetical protein
MTNYSADQLINGIEKLTHEFREADHGTRFEIINALEIYIAQLVEVTGA